MLININKKYLFKYKDSSLTFNEVVCLKKTENVYVIKDINNTKTLFHINIKK